MTKIDTTKPLEAVHKTSGRVVPVTFSRRAAPHVGGFYTKECPDPSRTNNGWDDDGTDHCSHNEWFVRNVAEAPKVDWTKPLELTDGTPVTLLSKSVPGYRSIRIDAAVNWNGRTFPAGTSNFQYKEDGSRFIADTFPAVRNVIAATLDLSKPLELTDGTPVVYLGKLNSGNIRVRIPADHEFRGVRHFTPEGRRAAHHSVGQAMIIRNRKEQPTTMLNLSKPLTTRDGRSVTFVSTLSSGQLLFKIASPKLYAEPALEIRFADGRVVTTRGALSPGDVINKVVETTVFRNVYADKVSGDSDHKSLSSAQAYCKVGKTRIGILTVTSVDGAVTSSKYAACVPYTRPTAFDTGVFVAA